MQFKKYILLCITLLFSISLTSCLSITRTIKLNADGSGTENLSMHMDKEYFLILASFASAIDSTKRQDIMNSLYSDSLYISKMKSRGSSQEGVKILDATSVTNEDSSKIVTVLYSFENISDLQNPLNDNGSSTRKSMETVIFKDNGSTASFLYKRIENQDNENSESSVSSEITRLLEGDKFIMSVEMPYDVISSNAHITAGRTLTWEYDMKALAEMKGPLIMEAELRK
jgi:hypothetical protein